MKKIGKYEIINILGKGAMGIVYKALDPVINREVAIKTIRFDLAHEDSENEEIMQRFMREAQAAGKLSHPNIITIYDVGREESVTYIVMQLIEGKSLQRVIATGEKLTAQEVIDLMTQICSALDYAHRNGIVHRDMKPGNILLDKEGKPFICDFGVARVDTSTLTQSGTAVGTPSYMSPEQVMGKKVDKRSDIFSLGCILFELLTGRRPFEAESITTVIYKIINEEPPPLSEVKKGLPVGFEHIIDRALAKDANARYQSCADLAADLRRVTTLSEKTIAITTPRVEVPKVEEEEVIKKKKSPALAISVAAVLVIVIGGGFYLYQTGRLPFLSGKAQETKAVVPSGVPEEKPVVTESIEDKLNRVKENFDRGDYGETIRLANEILSADANNETAKDYFIRATAKIAEPLKAQIQPEQEVKTEKPPSTAQAKTTTPTKTLTTTPPKVQSTTESKAQPTTSDTTKKIVAEEKKTEPTPTPAPAKPTVSEVIEEKLKRANESFEKKDYDETIRLAQEVIAINAGNLKAQEYLDKANAKKQEADLIAQTLAAGKESYDNGDYEQCLRQMNEILKLNKEHKEALRYRNLADKAIYEAEATIEIRQIVERQRKAEEGKDPLALIQDSGSQSFSDVKKGWATMVFNNYDEIKWSNPDVSIEFKGRNNAEVSLVYIATAVIRSTGQKRPIHQGTKVWTLEKQGDSWKIIKEEVKSII